MKNLKILVSIITFLSATQLYAIDCYEISNKTIELKWTAFKTLGKIGVTGSFDKITLGGTLKAAHIPQVVASTTFEIDTTSVNSKKPERDAKLKNFIFKKLNGSKITGSFGKMAKGILSTKITMNGVTKEVPLSYKLNKNTISANGHIDMFDFAMNKQVKAINKACYALHKGKTWSDVELQLLAKFTTCKK